jgi:hypothetical protein
VHTLLLGENALKAVLLTGIKLGLILEESLLHRLLYLLSLVKLRLTLVHLPHLPLLLQRSLLQHLYMHLLLLRSHLLQLSEMLWGKPHSVRIDTTHGRVAHVAHTTHTERALANTAHAPS